MGLLTPRRRKFVAAYVGVANGNATEAARIAGFEFPTRQGSRLLTLVDVKTEIDARLGEALKEFSGDDVRRVLIDHALADVGAYIEEIGRCPHCERSDLKFDLAKLKADGKTHLIRRIKTNSKTGDITIDLHDSQAAADKLAKLFGLYRPAVEEEHSLASIMAQALREPDPEEEPTH